MDILRIDTYRYEIQEQWNSGMVYGHIPAHLKHCYTFNNQGQVYLECSWYF
jgi:hypothetical protein